MVCTVLADDYFSGRDADGNRFQGHTDCNGYFHGTDSNGNSFHGYSAPH